MIRKRLQRANQPHFALLVNHQAGCYSASNVKKLLEAIKAKKCAYTLYEPESAADLLAQAEVAVGLRPASQRYPGPWERGGKVTGLIACGGDGTFNLVARAAMAAGLPMGCLPMGKTSSIARSFCAKPSLDTAIEKILAGKYRTIDVGMAADLPFFGSLGMGFIPRLSEQLEGRPIPRSGLGWSKLASRAASDSPSKKLAVKVDSFRFEIRPLMFQVNLLPMVLGLPFTPASVPDDGKAEVLFDHEPSAGKFSSFVRLINKGKYLYGNEIRLYRGSYILCQYVKGRKLYLDGEVTEITKDILEIQIEQNKLGFFC